MKDHIEKLFKLDRQLLGKGYNEALTYIHSFIPLQTLAFTSGRKVADWVVPHEWKMTDGWIKLNGEKILDYKLNPLAVSVYSLPVHKKVKLEELKSHVKTSAESPDEYAYDFKFYDRDWGFTMPKTQFEKLEEGEYEVFIDSMDVQSRMRIGVHTIKGKTDREVLLFAHLDHPYQANDNLSAVACLIDLAPQLEGKYDHTIKIIFCAETVGSILYAETQDISKVDFVLSLDSIGNDNSLLWQKSFDVYNRLNYCAHLAVAGEGVSYRKGEFRLVAGADEYYFNDPKVGIPGLFLSRLPFKEYHSSADTPQIIIEEKLKEVQRVVMKTIEIYEKDFIPQRGETKGPLMRSKHGLQTPDKLVNRDLDYLWYNIDGKKWVSELTIGLGLAFDYVYAVIKQLEDDKLIERLPHTGKIKKQ